MDSPLQGEGHNIRIHNVLFGGKYSFRLNPLQCAYFIDTKLNEWFGLLENKIILIYDRFRNLKLYM